MKASKNLDEWVCTMVEILDGKTTVLVLVNRQERGENIITRVQEEIFTHGWLNHK